MMATMLLILTSNTVVDIILNFTAVNFISNLDDYAFCLAFSGKINQTLEDEATRIANRQEIQEPVIHSFIVDGFYSSAWNDDIRLCIPR